MVSYHMDGTTEFAFFRPGAQQVQLAGDFNEWKPETHQLNKDKEGWWRIRLALPAGEYRFKYLVDGEIWEADFAAYGVENDKHGGWNSVLWIKENQYRKSAAA